MHVFVTFSYKARMFALYSRSICYCLSQILTENTAILLYEYSYVVQQYITRVYAAVRSGMLGE